MLAKFSTYKDEERREVEELIGCTDINDEIMVGHQMYPVADCIGHDADDLAVQLLRKGYRCLHGNREDIDAAEDKEDIEDEGIPRKDTSGCKEEFMFILKKYSSDHRQVRLVSKQDYIEAEYVDASVKEILQYLTEEYLDLSFEQREALWRECMDDFIRSERLIWLLMACLPELYISMMDSDVMKNHGARIALLSGNLKLAQNYVDYWKADGDIVPDSFGGQECLGKKEYGMDYDIRRILLEESQKRRDGYMAIIEYISRCDSYLIPAGDYLNLTVGKAIADMRRYVHDEMVSEDEVRSIAFHAQYETGDIRAEFEKRLTGIFMDAKQYLLDDYYLDLTDVFREVFLIYLEGLDNEEYDLEYYDTIQACDELVLDSLLEITKKLSVKLFVEKKSVIAPDGSDVGLPVGVEEVISELFDSPMDAYMDSRVCMLRNWIEEGCSYFELEDNIIY